MSFDYGLCLLAAFLASLVSGLGGFGGGFIIVLFLAPVVGPKAVIPLVAAYAIFGNISRILVYRRDIDWPLVGQFTLASLPGVYLGANVFVWMNEAMLGMFLGLTLIIAVPIRRLLKKYEFQEGIDSDLEIYSFFMEGKIDHTFIFYTWFLEELKLYVIDYFFIDSENSNFENLVINQNVGLNQNIKNFLYRQGQLRVSLIIATLFFILTLYLNKVGVIIQFQKPLIFLGLFIFLEFILLTIDPFLQIQIENNYIISMLEVGLAALIIPFHSMVEHNLYQNENQNEPERP